MTTPPTTFTQRAAERIGYQLAIRPRVRRFITVWITTHLLGTWALIAAPQAAASTLAGALDWTGITDSRGVPIGRYYLSVVSTTEAITKAGPGLSAADPSSWTRWLANALTTGLTHEGIVELLNFQAGIYIFMMSMALWLMRFAMSNTWLAWLITWFRPLFHTIANILEQHMVFPTCLVAGLGVGTFHILWHGRKGFGAGIMLSTMVIGVLGTVITSDPGGDLAGENGLITRGRNAGFEVAQAAFNNGAITGGGGQVPMQHLTGLIADATIRMPLQLMNFGAPVDNIGSCAGAYTTAMLTPHNADDLAGPAHAMASCGAGQALSFAQHLSGENLATGVFFILLGAVFATFVCYVTYSYVMVCSAAFLNALLTLVTTAPAMIKGRPRKRGIRRIKMFFKHAGLVFAYSCYASVAAMIVLRTAARGGYADQVGMTHPMARLVVIAVISAVAIGGFWWLKHELGDHTREELTDTITDLYHHGRDGYQRGQDLYDRGRDLASSLSKNSSGDANNSTADTDQPLTGPPAQGRPPGGRPPRSGPKPPPTPPTGPAAGPTGAAAASGATEGVAAAAEAAGTVLAPEVVIPTVVAAHAAQPRRHSAKAPAGAPQSNGDATTQTPRAAPPAFSAPADDQSGATGPVAGRANTTQPRRTQPTAPTNGPQRPTPPPTDPGRQPGPVRGRQ